MSSGKTFYFTSYDVFLFNFFSFKEYRKYEEQDKKIFEKEKKDDKIKFCIVQCCTTNQLSFIEGIIQFERRITTNKARYYFLTKGITALFPKNVGTQIPYFLTKIKMNEEKGFVLAEYEDGSLSLGGGHRNYKEILNDVFYNFKNNQNKIYKDRISTKIMDILTYETV